MDMFATKQNRKYQKFCSAHGLSWGFLSDAFLLSCVSGLLYAFPPIPLVHNILLNVKRDRARVILIALVWPHQH